VGGHPIAGLPVVPALGVRHEIGASEWPVRAGFARCGHSSLQTSGPPRRSAHQQPNRGQSSRCRPERRPSQDAKSTRIAASSAGVACRDSPKSSVARRWPAQQPGSADITRNPIRRWVSGDITSRPLLRDPIGLRDRTRCAAYRARAVG
jgi:hypothetical protein